MSRARLVITAVVVEGRPVAQVAADYGVHRAWVYRLVARYRAEGEAAFQPRSRRPHRSPTATPPEVVDLVLRLRKELSEQGLDAGAHTICWHLSPRPHIRVIAAATGEVLRDLTLDPTKDYTNPRTGPKSETGPTRRFDLSPMS